MNMNRYESDQLKLTSSPGYGEDVWLNAQETSLRTDDPQLQKDAG